MNKILQITVITLILSFFAFAQKTNPEKVLKLSNASVESYFKLYDDSLTANPPSLEEAKRARNLVINLLTAEIDVKYKEFINKFSKTQRKKHTSDELKDIEPLAPNVQTKSLTNGERAQRIIQLAQLNSSLKGPSKTVKNQMLVLSMEIARLRIQEQILKSSEKDVYEYSLSQALGDLIVYYYAGSGIGAEKILTEILSKHKKELNELKMVRPK